MANERRSKNATHTALTHESLHAAVSSLGVCVWKEAGSATYYLLPTTYYPCYLLLITLTTPKYASSNRSCRWCSGHTFSESWSPVQCLCQFMRSAVARYSRPFLNRGWFPLGCLAVPLRIWDFGAFFCCFMSGSRARMRTCSFFATFSRFAVAACRAENGRARAHVLLFWHFV